MSLQTLMKKLDRLGGNGEQSLKKGIGIALKTIQAEAKLLAPVETGRLRNSISTQVSQENRELVGKVYTNMEYASYLEFGTGKIGEKHKPDVPIELHYRQDKWRVKIPDVGYRYISGQKPQPFLYPAFKANKAKVVKIIENQIREDIRKRVAR